MGKEDAVLMNYLEDEARCADLVDVLFCQGKGIVRACDVQEMDTALKTVSFRVNDRFEVQKYRDSVRRIATGMQVVIVGIENQKKMHYAMPVRIMLYDAIQYEKQLRQIRRSHRVKKDIKGAEFLSGFAKEDRICPVFTIVLYWGEQEWDGATELYELMNVEKLPEPVRKAVNNYRIFLVEVRKFAESEKFRTDLKEVFAFLQHTKDKTGMGQMMKQMVEQKEFDALDEDAYNVMATLGNFPYLIQEKDRYRTEGGKVNMCQAFQELMEEKYLEGIRVGEERGELRGEKRGERRGMRYGKQQGFRQREMQILKNMFQHGMSVQDAAKIVEMRKWRVRRLFRRWSAESAGQKQA